MTPGPATASPRAPARPAPPELLRVWTTVPAATWALVQERGSLRADPRRCNGPAAFRSAYAWMSGELHRHTGHRAWPWWGYRAPRPRLAHLARRWGPRGTSWVRLALALPADEVLCSDYQRWETLLGIISWSHEASEEALLADSAAEQEAWAALPPAARTPALLEESWRRVFRLDPAAWGDPAWIGPRRGVVQACFPFLRRVDVVAARPFVARRRGARRRRPALP